MLLADTMAWVFAVLGLLVALPGLWLLCRGLWPSIVERTTADCNRNLLLPLVCGIPIAAATIWAFALCSKLPGPWNGITLIVLVSSVVLFASTGITGLATVVGQRLPSPADAARPWNTTIRGGIILELAFLVPVLGWFFLLPLSLVIGAGAALRAVIGVVRSRPRKAKPIQTPAIETHPPLSDNGPIGAST